MLPLQRSQSLPTLHELTPQLARSHSAVSSPPPAASSGRQGIEIALQQQADPATALPLPAAHFTALLTDLGCALDTAHASVSEGLSAEEQALTQMVKLVIEDPQRAIESCTEGTACADLLQEITPALSMLEDSQSEDLSAREHRALAVLDCLGRLFRNDFTNAHGRRAANLAIATLRSGLITCVTTVVRQLIGYAAERSMLLAEAPVNQRLVFSFASQLLGPALNVAGAIRQECQGSATPQSRIARGVMLMLSVGSLVAASQISPQLTALSGMSGASVQIASYCLARDLIQMFFPMGHNAPMTLSGNLGANAAYAGLRFGVGSGMDLLAPHSGSSYVRSVAQAARDNGDAANAPARVHAALQALTPVVSHDVLRGIFNAIPEAADDMVRNGANREVQVQRNISAARTHAQALGQNPDEAVAALPASQTEGLRLRMSACVPTPGQVADQFLTTCAMRMSAFEIVLGATVAANVAIKQLGLGETEESLAVNAVLGLMAGAIYMPFVYGHQTRPPRPATPPEMELRQRRPEPQP